MHLFPSIAVLCCAGVGDEESALRFRVVDALTGQVCPGATVHFLDASNPRSWTADPFWSLQERFEHTGASVIADESGTATLPGDVETRAVGAVSNGRFGSVRGWFDRRSSPHVIQVFPVRELLLRIVDDRDRPSPVEILVCEQKDGGWHQWQRTKADADGLACVWTLEGCPSSPVFWPTHQRFDDGQRLHLLLDMVTDEPLVATIDTAAVPTVPLPVRVPPFGELVVRVRGADGVPARAGYVHANVVDAPFLPGRSKPILEGVARFPAVELGLTLDLTVSGTLRSAELPGVTGPVSVGQSLTVDIELPERRHDGRAVLEVCGRARLGGRNVASRTLHAAVLRGGSLVTPYSLWNSTDEAGDFRFEFLHDWQTGDELLVSVASGEGLAPIDSFARLPLPVPVGPIDLGDVQLAPAPLLCAGAIVDERDRPVEASLLISTDEQAVLLPGSRLSSRPSGTFALHTFRLPDREPQISLSFPASSVATWSAHFSVRPGTDNLQLECQRGWSVEGRAVLDEGIPKFGVSVQLIDARLERNSCVIDPLDWPTCQETRLAPDGHFFAGRVVPGPHHLVFRWAEAFELHRVENLWIGADGSYDSSRTAEVDLRGTLRIVTAYGEVEGGGTLPEGDLRLSPLSSSLDPWIEGYPPVFTKLSPRPTRLVVPRGSYQLGFRNKTHVAKPVPIEGDLVRVLLRPK